MQHAYDHDHIHHPEEYWCDTVAWIKRVTQVALFEVPVPGDTRLSPHLSQLLASGIHGPATFLGPEA